MMCIAFIATFVVGFACGFLVLAPLPEDDPPTGWTNTGC